MGKTAVGAALFTRGWARGPGSFVTSISTPQVLGVSPPPTCVPVAAAHTPVLRESLEEMHRDDVLLEPQALPHPHSHV